MTRSARLVARAARPASPRTKKTIPATRAPPARPTPTRTRARRVSCAQRARFSPLKVRASVRRARPVTSQARARPRAPRATKDTTAQFVPYDLQCAGMEVSIPRRTTVPGVELHCCRTVQNIYYNLVIHGYFTLDARPRTCHTVAVAVN